MFSSGLGNEPLSFDNDLASLVKDAKLRSIGDYPSIQKQLPPYAERWTLDYKSLAQNTLPAIDPLNKQFMYLGGANETNCDAVWACNVISNQTIIEDKKGLSDNFLIYQTLASFAEMLKPKTGKLLCVDQYFRQPHAALYDGDFHKQMGMQGGLRKEYAAESYNANVFEFTSNDPKMLTPLNFCRWFDENRSRIENGR